jgi:tRNA modification GTPase
MSSPFSSEDTIAAISTPPGPGAIGMVRITGSEAHAVGRRIFTPAGGAERPFPARRAIFGQVHPPGQHGQPIDLAVLCFYAGPRTYTGEDTVEITVHGGPLIMRALLDAAVAGGARLAEPGEFTRRAFINGRMDLAQAEAVASLIFASTEEAREVMLRQVEGAMGKEVRKMRAHLLEMKVGLEASIDFPDDVGEADQDHLLMLLLKVSDIAERLMGTARKGIALGEGFNVVITGAPNVGKSCLLNALLEENPVESEGVERTRELIGVADMLIVVLDASRPIHLDEEKLLHETRALKRVVAVNKTDLALAPGFTFPEGATGISALNGDGIEELKRAIYDVCTGGPSGVNLERGVVTTARQAEALGKIIDSCIRIRTALEEVASSELVAVGVDEALMGLRELTGEVTTEEVLEEIFSRFCIGK